MTCGGICDIMNRLYPEARAEAWDNVGPAVGRRGAAVSKILIGLDVTDGLIDEAVKIGAEMIITHHPFIHDPLARVTDDGAKGARLFRLLDNRINVYCAHTNLDIAEDGTSAALARRLGLRGLKPFAPAENGAGHFGRLGAAEGTTLAAFAAFAARELGVPAVRYYGGGDRPVRLAAVVAGGGMRRADYTEAAALGADVYVTGDVKYHAAQDALDLGLAVLDVTHDGGERAALPVLAERLAAELGGRAEIVIGGGELLARCAEV